MKTIRQLLRQKGHQVWSIGRDMSVYDALDMMADKGVGALVVLDGYRVIGMISERDYARKVILQGRSSKETRVEEIMDDDVHFGELDDTIEDAMKKMTAERVRHLPVLHRGQLVGVVSLGDLVWAQIAEQKFIIEQLEMYIGG